ncbi:MAG: PQQ-binding-like beta-propeller repeat protein [Lentisphaerae bacterium]|jgi:outer membrane protein assembly factor BamB|nr:PQQ-binding-like beta-propeller repeat protein [Lentisphaerota bacterium]
MHRSKRLISTSPAIAVLALLVAAATNAADWPAYRHDFARSGLTTEQLSLPLHLHWSYKPQHGPRPAWPEPGRELHRLAFDYAADVVAAQGLVLFGSSADHKVYALDLKTGAERWSFFTGAPIRFAPAIAGNRVFVASDDGVVRCLNLASGALVWEFHGGPTRELMFGNGQLMGRWPIRTGVAVDQGTVYFAAGMWPSEGVYVYALGAADGKVIWQQLETATRYQKQPHPGSFALLGVAPQGYVVGNDTQMFIPTGRNVPAAFSRANGGFQYYHSAPAGWGNRWGGTWNMIVRDKLVGWRNHHVPDVNTVVGEGKPHAEDGLVVFDAKSGNRALEVKGKLRAVADGSVLYASGAGKIGAYDLDGWFGEKGWKARWESNIGRTYSLVKAGDALVAGGEGTVAVCDANGGKTIWQAATEGQVRSLAVADGRLLASTTTGHILCFGAADAGQPQNRSPQEDATAMARMSADQAARSRTDTVLKATGVSKGYCLALAPSNASFLYHLSQATELTTYVPEPDAGKAQELRQGLDTVGLYGPRVVVQSGTLTTLRFPPYFADLIILGDGSTASREGQAAEEVYRLVRPHGGKIYIPLDDPGSAVAGVTEWLKEGGVPAAEITQQPDAILVSRGKLPRSDNWSHQYGNPQRTGSSADERVKLPLRLLWFGEPGPATIVSRHWQGPAPLCVDGRMIVTGQRHISVVDAYNGRVLWRREFPQAGRWSIPGKGSNVVATADSVFLATKGQCARLAAGTGEDLNAYSIPDVPALPDDLRAALGTWCFLAADGNQLFGSMGRSVSEGQCLFSLEQETGDLQWAYVASGPVPNNGISVGKETVFLIERISGTDAEAARRRGEDVDAGKRLVALDRGTGAIRWTTQDKVGSRTTLWLSKGVLVAIGGGGLTGYSADTGAMLYTRTAGFRRSAVIARDTIYVQPLAFDLFTGESRLREGTFTDAKSPWNFVRSYGCGTMGGGPNLLAFRSATIGFYGLDGDTGVHNFPAVRAGCCINAIPANGLLLVSPGDAGCSCSYSYQTTLALVPDEARDNWGVFYDRLPNTAVDRVSLNLGAPGDRRSEDGSMWLATPRPRTRSHRTNIAVPFRYDCLEGFGPYYKAAASRNILGTETPWVHSSGIRGIRHLEVDLDILDRGMASWFAPVAPTVDGKLEEACWDGYKAYPSQASGGSVMLRYDRENLYLGCTRQLPSGTSPKTNVTVADGPVWEDDAFEVLISNRPAAPTPQGTTCLHMALSPSGAKYDAKWTYVSAYGTLDIPQLEVIADGDPRDWGDDGLRVTSLPGPRGVLRAPENLDPCFRIAWCPEGLLVLAEITDNAVCENSNTGRLYQGDSLELFMTPGIGNRESFQVVIAPGASKKYTTPRHRFYDRRRSTKGSKLALQVGSAAVPGGYLIEALLPWSNLKIDPALGTEFGLQVLVNDSDKGTVRGPHALWHPAGNTEKHSLAYQGFRLAAAAAPPITFTRTEKPTSRWLYSAVKPHAFPLSFPSLGADQEQAEYNAGWQSAVQLAGQTFTAEMAIPWKVLAEAGLHRDQLMISVSTRGPLPSGPRKGRGFEQLLLVPMSKTESHPVDVRLHFREPDGAKPGQRVFDVKLQGETVLTDFDVAKAATATGNAVVKEFREVSASRALFVDFIPKSTAAGQSDVPVLSGIELRKVKR